MAWRKRLFDIFDHSSIAELSPVKKTIVEPGVLLGLDMYLRNFDAQAFIVRCDYCDVP